MCDANCAPATVEHLANRLSRREFAKTRLQRAWSLSKLRAAAKLCFILFSVTYLHKCSFDMCRSGQVRRWSSNVPWKPAAPERILWKPAQRRAAQMDIADGAGAQAQVPKISGALCSSMFARFRTKSCPHDMTKTSVPEIPRYYYCLQIMSSDEHNLII